MEIKDLIRSKGRSCEERKLIYDPFAGSNEEFEIEDLDEFYDKIQGRDLSTFSFQGWVFQAVDFSTIKLDIWNQLILKDAEFLGCKFPQDITAEDVRKRGAVVWETHPNVPFTSLRAFMYTQSELREKDDTIYKYYLSKRSLDKTLAESMHDFSMLDAMGDYLENKTPIGIMGGHRLERGSSEYRTIVYLARDLVKKGFLIVTGGGPGAMEAANLGAYLANKTDEQAVRALQIISEGNEQFAGVEYLNQQPPENVIQELGPTTYMPSLGVPTYRYGHEPSNRFATWHAKFFSNALREDGLLSISSGGIIYFRGGAGTRQEIFQAACHNTYCKPQDTRPLILYGCDYWKENGVWNTLESNGRGSEFHKYLLLSDDSNEIIKALVNHASIKKLPMINDLEELTKPYWKKKPNN